MDWKITDNLDDALDRLLRNKPLEDFGAVFGGGREGAEGALPGEEREVIAGLWMNLQKLQQMHQELQQFAIGLSKGELATPPPPRTNYLASGLKQLQMHLRHLTWQTRCISEGDYNQKVDFMGEFSEAFNKMVGQMRDRENSILTQRETMLRVFDQIEPIFIVAESNPMLVLYANKMAKLRFHLEGDSKAKRDLLHSVRTKCQPHHTEQIKDADSGRWYRVSCERFFWDQELDSMLYHCVDITSHIKRENDLEQEAHTDKLTGLNNRYVFERSFDKLWEMCRQNRSPLSVVIFDIDFFKKCNDTYGHLQGDKCLVTFAGILRSHIGRFNDIVARFGGEEFIALLPYTGEEATARIAETVRRETELMEIPFIGKDPPETPVKITVSAGVASCVPTFEDVQEELVASADRALYEAKQTGRNKICIAGKGEFYS